MRGLDNVLTAIHHVFASLYNDRAIAYRVHHNFQHHEVALSAGIQRMARSVHHRRLWPRRDRGAGRCQSRRVLHLQAGARRRQAPILSCKLGSKAIKMIYGDSAAHGKTTKTVEVDEADRMRFCLTDEQLLDLARQAMIIEKHYGHPMDIEWALDGTDGKVYIVQARPRR